MSGFKVALATLTAWVPVSFLYLLWDGRGDDTPIFEQNDLSLWRFPGPLRRAVVFPLAVVAGSMDAIGGDYREAVVTYRQFMDAVKLRPEARR